MSIVEIFPAADGSAPIQRTATAPRDLASSIMLLLYCTLSVAEIVLAVAAMLVAGIYEHTHKQCLMNYMPNGHNMCYFVFVAAAFTFPLAVGVMVTELLPSSRVSPGVRNLVPLLLVIVGMALWGVAATALKDRHLQPSESNWRKVLSELAWSNTSLFLICCCIKLLSPALEPCIDAASISLGRICPEGCMPACDACCCLDVRTAKVPREVLRQGQVVTRFMTWNQELVTTSAAPEGVTPMSRWGGGNDCSIH